MEELSTGVIERVKGSPLPIQNTLCRLGNNIELWMTYLSQPQPWLREEHHLRNKALATEIRRHISDIISDHTVSTMESPAPKWLTSLIRHWHSQRCTVISLNYDTLVERASASLPSDGSGRISVTQMYPPYFSALASRLGSGSLGEIKVGTFLYLKLHGSISWFYSGRESFYGEPIFLSYVPPWGTSGLDKENSGASYGGDKTPLIIPPVTDKLTYFNNETVRRLWQEASEALGSAKRVFVIGYSLPITDMGMEFFLKESLPEAGATWYVVDTNAEVLVRYRRALSQNQTINADFVCKQNPVAKFVESYPSLPA